jgi:hypothetical protein
MTAPTTGAIGPAALAALLDQAGTSQVEAATLCRVDDRTMRRWLADPAAPSARAMPPPAAAALAMSLLLLGRVQPADVAEWLPDAVRERLTT